MSNKELIENKIKEHDDEILLLDAEFNKVKEELKNNKSKENLNKTIILKDRIYFHKVARFTLENLLKELKDEKK